MLFDEPYRTPPPLVAYRRRLSTDPRGPYAPPAEWIPEGWESPSYPVFDDVEAIRQWLDSVLDVCESRARQTDDPAVYILTAEIPWVRDAYRLIGHLERTRQWGEAPKCSAPKLFATCDGLRQAAAHLRIVREWIERRVSGVSPAHSTEGDLAPAARRAYYAYSWAEGRLMEGGATRVTDKDAYGWLEQNGFPDEKDSPQLAAEFAGYRLPAFDTWSRQVRNARNVLNGQKHRSRTAREAGRSIARGRDIERQRGADD